jgi:winged helix DNA-binding protein
MVAVMAAARTLDDDGVRRLRSAAQLLHRPGRRSAADLVRHLTGVQAQVTSAAALTLRARTERFTATRVDRARLRDRSIVLTWAMRGTLHLIAAEDYGWLVPLVVEPRVSNAHRRLKQEGVSSTQSARAVRLIEQMLGRDGPLTRPEIADRLRRHRIRTEGQAIAHLVWLAAAEGLICHGPDRDHTRSFVLVRDWLSDRAPMDQDGALAELAVRYLQAHGPAEPADLAYWSGIRPGDAKRAWRGIEDRLTEMSTTSGPRWVLRSHRDRAPARLVRLLPAFDEYLLGWKDRTLTASTGDWKTINRGGGWLHPVVLIDGRAAATWTMHRTGDSSRLEVASFSRPTPALRRGITLEAKDLGSFLKSHVVVVLD